MYHPCSENKGADQLCSYCEVDLHLRFLIGENPVSSRCGTFIILGQMLQLTLFKNIYSFIKMLQIFIYTQQKKLRKMCSSVYCNKSSKVLEIQTLVSYKVSFYLSIEASLEVVASAVAGKNNVKVV